MADNKHALYLVKDGEAPKLFHKEDVEGAKVDGWKEPTFPKSNGAEWNAEEDLAGQDYAADFAKEKAKTDAEKAKKEDAERLKAEAAKPDPVETPDLKVQVVDPVKPAKAPKK